MAAAEPAHDAAALEPSDALRGPRGGFAHSHPGLTAFWRELAPEIASPPTHAEARALADLERWLRDGPRHGAVILPNEPFRARVLARWALTHAGDRGLYVVFLPVTPRAGTATERDALQVLLGLFPNSEAALFSVPRSPQELAWAASFALGGRGLSSGDDDAEDPIVLFVIEGLDRLADAPPERLVPPLHEMGNETRVLVAISTPNLPSGEGPLADRLGADPDTVALLQLPSEPETPLPDLTALAAAERRALTALACALAPVSPADLAWLTKEPVPAELPFCCRTDDGKLFLASEPLLRALASSSSGEPAWSRALIAHARAALSPLDRIIARFRFPPYFVEDLVEDLVASSGFPPYAVEYLGAHLILAGAPLDDFIQLLDPIWSGLWRRQPNAVTGLATDIRRARAALREALVAAPAADRALLAADLVRAIVAEAVLFELEGSRSADRDRALPFVAPTLAAPEPETTARCWSAVARLLATFASVLPQEARPPVDSLVAEARRYLPPASADLAEPSFAPVPLPTTADGTVAGIAPVDAFSTTALADPEAWMNRALHLEGYTRIRLLAEILPYLPPQRTAEAAAAVVDAYFAEPEDVSLPLVLACAAWMPAESAVRVLDLVGNDWSTTLDRTLLAPAGLASMAHVLRAAGGDNAVQAAAHAAFVAARTIL